MKNNSKQESFQNVFFSGLDCFLNVSNIEISGPFTKKLWRKLSLSVLFVFSCHFFEYFSASNSQDRVIGPEGNGKNETSLIIGTVIAGSVLLLAIALALFCWLRRRSEEGVCFVCILL